jgi:gluconolactonase
VRSRRSKEGRHSPGALLALLVLAGCGSSGGPGGGADGGVADTLAAAEAAAATPAPGDGGPIEEAPAVACNALPPLPWAFRLESGPPASEDFTFDEEGYLVALSTNNLVRMARAGAPQLVAPSVAIHGTGVRALPGGSHVVADEVRGAVQRIDPNGNRRNVGTNIRGPNGIQIGPGGQLYVTDMSGGNLYRVDPEAGGTTLLQFVVFDADGLVFATDYRTLFVNSFGTGEIFKLPVMPDGTVGPPAMFVTGLGHPDGMTIDECGNLYVAGYGDGILRRVAPDGKIEVVADFQTKPVTAVNFGSGKHGWDARTLYVMNFASGGVFAVPVGVRGAPPPPRAP